MKITNLVDNCPPVTLLGASLELEYPLLSTIYYYLECKLKMVCDEILRILRTNNV